MEPFRVLIVDDEKDFLETVVKRLIRKEIDAKGAESGLEALKILEKESFDIIVLDIMMPGMDGIDTLKVIKRQWPGVEVILLTGHGSVESGIKGIQLGAYNYVLKPAKLDDLILHMREAFKRKQIRETVGN